VWPIDGGACQALGGSTEASDHFLARFGRIDEWHLYFAKSFEHLLFDLLPRLRQAVVSHGPAFRHARPKAVGATRDAVRGDGPFQLLVKLLSMLNTPVALVSNHRLESLEDLNRRLETDGPRSDACWLAA
jgi:hypothetical protein